MIQSVSKCLIYHTKWISTYGYVRYVFVFGSPRIIYTRVFKSLALLSHFLLDLISEVASLLYPGIAFETVHLSSFLKSSHVECFYCQEWWSYPTPPHPNLVHVCISEFPGNWNGVILEGFPFSTTFWDDRIHWRVKRKASVEMKSESKHSITHFIAATYESVGYPPFPGS